MSESRTIWMIFWRRALRSHNARAPFEIADIVPEVARGLNISEQEATRQVAGLLKELDRLPAGKQFFRREGNAIVPLAEFERVHQDPQSELAAYPYEL